MLASVKGFNDAIKFLSSGLGNPIIIAEMALAVGNKPLSGLPHSKSPLVSHQEPAAPLWPDNANRTLPRFVRNSHMVYRPIMWQ